jgi:hypothetical protein
LVCIPILSEKGLIVDLKTGPILPILKWNDEKDVIARANDTIYGLGASVWSSGKHRPLVPYFTPHAIHLTHLSSL